MSGWLEILELAVESARNGIVITDARLPDNPIVYANRFFTEMTGYESEEILGRNCRFLQGVDKDQIEVRQVAAAIREGRPYTALLRNYRKDGSLFWNELTISPVRDENGDVINFIGVQNDVTARKEAERRVSEFYSIVSHELRTPLSSIRASLGLIAHGEAGNVAPHACALAHAAISDAERLLKLIDDVLDCQKMHAKL